MARDNELIITAGLDIPQTTEDISTDLEKVGDKLNADHALKITCNIDVSKTTQAIQSQLNTISEDLSIKIGNIDLNSIQNNISKQTNGLEVKAKIKTDIDKKSTAEQVKELEKILDLKLTHGNTNNIRKEIQSLLDDYKNAFSNNNFEEMQNSFNKLDDYIRQFRKEIELSNDELTETQQKIKELARNGKLYISDSDFSELSNIVDGGRNASAVLTRVFGFGGWTKDSLKGTHSWDQVVQEMNEVFQKNRFDELSDIDSGRFNDHIDGIVQLLQYLDKNFKDNTEYVKHYGEEIESAWGNKLYNSLEKVLGLSSSMVDENGFETIFDSDDFEKTTAKVNEFVSSINNLRSTQEILQSYKEALGGERATAIEEANGQLQKFAIYVSASENTTEKLTFKLNKLSKEFEYVGKSIHEANNSTDLRKKPVDVSRDIQIGELDKFSMKIASSEIANSEHFKVKIQELRKQLEDVFDTTSLNAFLNAFSRVKAEFESFDSVTSSINDSIRQLDKMSDNVTLSKNLSDPQVQNQIQLITELRGEYEKLLQEVSETKDVKSLADIESKFYSLNSRMLEVQQSNDKLSSSLKNASSLETLNNRIKKTIVSMDVYANANKKAISSTKLMSDGVTTFAEKWDELTSRMNSGNLSADEFKHINEELATFKQEVKAAGLDSGAFFRKMGDQIRLVVTQWISLNAVIGKTRDMVSNVIEIDTAMTNLKKVTNETSRTYNQFADRAIAKAKELKTGYADLINQSAEWVKRGYDLNEAMELSTSSGIYSVVGEVDNATAVQHLTTVMKSYNMTVDESIDIVDKFNNISNKYSVNASDIGAMLTNSISSLSVAGNTLDQAIAMGTTISEITGDASEAGNTLKVLSMRLRGAKTEIENAGESTDGMAESTSKLRDQIKALTNVTGNGGFDIMLDENTFKSTYDIMKGISEVWDDINGTNQSALIELIAGKQRGNTVSALLTNMAQADDILQDSLNSAGSAVKEYENYLNSTESKIQGFKTAFEDLSDTIINGDFLKTAIDSGTKLINILDTIINDVGVLPTLTGAIAGGLSFKGVGRPKTEYA